jgi:hypothetical protein
LARLLRASRSASIAQGAAQLMQSLEERGVDPNTREIGGARATAAFATVLQLLMLLVVPAAMTLLGIVVIQNFGYAAATDAPSQMADAIPSDDIQSLGAKNTATRNSAKVTAHCATPPQNGDVLQGQSHTGDDQNRLVVENSASENAIVRLRNAETGKTFVSFFVAPESTVAYTKIPDGRYNIQYAFGGELDRSCTTFLAIREPAQDPHPETFVTQSNDTGYHFQELDFKLYPAPEENRAEPIDAATFDAN